MFSDIHYRGNPIPLLYVVIGNGTGEDGFYYRCAVENIVRHEDVQGKECYSAETVQMISCRPGAEDQRGYEKPCWGCPAFLIDCGTLDSTLQAKLHKSDKRSVL